MSDEYLYAVFSVSGGSYAIGFKNPVSWKCYEIRSCSNWQPTEIVMWNLPSTKYGNLYTSDKCKTDGHYYISDKKKKKGRGRLVEIEKFQSMMVAEYLDGADRPSLTYSKKCSTKVQEHGSIEGATVEVANGRLTENGSSEGNSTSSNWFDALPEKLASAFAHDCNDEA